MPNNSPDNLDTPPVSPPAPFAVRAEQELKELLDSDPELRAQWEQASLHAKALAESLQEAAKSPEFQEVQAALKDRRATQEVRERFEAAQRELQNVCDMLERLHLGRPETLQDWAHLGRVTEMSEERLLAGDYTVREVFEHAMAWVHRQIARARLEYEARPPHAEPSPAEQKPVEEGKTKGKTPARKRSTERGEGRAKLIAALTKHHQYADGGCLNQTPIGNNELARLAKVSVATASAFFKDEFEGHLNYRKLCQDARGLTTALKLLNGEFSYCRLLGDASSYLAAPERDDADSE